MSMVRSDARVTIRDVASLAGASVASVSRVVSGGAKVSPALRQRVEDAVRALSYSPHPGARELSLGSPLRLEVQSNIEDDGLAGAILHAIVRECSKTTLGSIQVCWSAPNKHRSKPIAEKKIIGRIVLALKSENLDVATQQIGSGWNILTHYQADDPGATAQSTVRILSLDAASRIIILLED